ncbi:MAG TPA: hypothetical protein VG223_07655 [Solirubrobacteraceae bacterium]|jgi:hypothetical protein|nr:hypothetical protein [Solirubrobacteraceae bacterium]
MSLPFAAPALPLHSAGPYVAAAYIVFVALILVYVVIMVIRVTRNQRDIAKLADELRARELQEEHDREISDVA